MMVLSFKMNVHIFSSIAIPNGIIFFLLFVVVPVWYRCFVYSLHILYTFYDTIHTIVNDLNAFTLFMYAVVLLSFRKRKINVLLSFFRLYIFFWLFTWWFQQKIFSTRKRKLVQTKMNIMNLFLLRFRLQKNVFRFTFWNVYTYDTSVKLYEFDLILW